MPGSSSTSFIPKHTSNKGERKNSPRQLFIGTLLVRILFFATLISAVGLYFFINKLNTELVEAKASFDAITKTFTDDQDDVDMVTSLDKRLTQANDRFRNGVSINALILAIEKATLSTVQFTNLQIDRINDNSIELVASLKTEGFDSVIFQRELLRQSDELGVADVADVSIQYNTETEDEFVIDQPEETKVITFQASIDIDPGAIRSVVITNGILPPLNLTPVTISDNLPAEVTGSAEEESSVGVQISNQENI